MVRPKEFIHLNMVSNETQEEEDNEFKSKCLLLQLYGDVAAIKKKRRPMEMEDIGRSEETTPLPSTDKIMCSIVRKLIFSCLTFWSTRHYWKDMIEKIRDRSSCLSHLLTIAAVALEQ